MRFWREDGSIMGKYISYLNTSRRIRRREVLHNILRIWYTYETRETN
jgi:hypothetical protein